MSSELSLVMLISGGGTTMQYILRAIKSGELKGVRPAMIIASKPGIKGIERALEEGVDESAIRVVSPKDYPGGAFADRLLCLLREARCEVVGQYGWLPYTPDAVTTRYVVINQHPGPLDTGYPDFGGKGMYGRRVHAARLHFVRAVGRDFTSEATAHWAIPGFDRGAVIGREVVAIEPNDNVASLQEKMLPAEYRVQVRALEDVINGTVREFRRTERLVRSEEYAVLEEAKQEAELRFPKG